jgi:membrane-bound serine protease (ClpP class)
LIAVGLVLFLLELKLTSYGLLLISGTLATVLGALMLFDSPEPALRVSLRYVLPITIAATILFLVAMALALRTMKRKPSTGREGILGMEGEARTHLAPHGTVEVRGELWSAIAPEPLEKGARVEVVGVEGLVLKVRKRAERGA